MKNLIFSILLCGFCMILEAQKVDLAKKNYSYVYRNLPNLVHDKNYKTYSVSVDKTVVRDLYSGVGVNNKIIIEGRKNIIGRADLNVEIWMGNLKEETKQVESRAEVRVDENGNEISRTSSFTMEVVYTFETNAVVKDYYGNPLQTYKLLNRSGKDSYTAHENTNSFVSLEHNNNNLSENKAGLIAEQVDQVLSTLNSNLNYDFGYLTVKSTENLWALKSKKHPEYTAFNDAVTNAKTAIELITPDSIPEGVYEKLKQSIEYFNGILTNNSIVSDINQKKLRYASYYNLALIYYSIENFEKAIDMCNLLIQNDYNIKDGEQLIEEVNNTTTELQNHAMTTRHFNPDFEK